MAQTWHIPLLTTDALSDSRGYINDALAALRSSFSGSAEPSTPVTGQWFIDTDTNNVYLYNGTTWQILGGANVAYFNNLPRVAGSSYPLSGDLYMGTHQVKGVTDPTLSTDAATKNYSDTTFLAKGGGVMTGDITCGANNITMDHNPTLSTHLVRKAYADLFDPLAGSTWTGNHAAGGFKLTGLGAPTATADAATMSYVDDYFDVSEGHDHGDGGGKPVTIEHVNPGTVANGSMPVVGSNALAMLLPWGVLRVAAPTITTSYADIVEVTLNVPRTTSILYGRFTCVASMASAGADDAATLDIRILNAANATQREKLALFYMSGNSNDALSLPIAFDYYWVPGATGNETFTVQIKKAEVNCTITISDAVLWCNTIG